MNFKENQAIYLQIAAFLSDKILKGEYLPGMKIPSIREVAVGLEVNPNTVQRSFDFLQQNEIIEMKRGVGFFVQNEAVDRILEIRRQNFVENTLPELAKEMSLLSIKPEDLIKMIQDLNKN
jgi:DNA-binding transcriptional regulator YhcF (GntR family)